MWHGAKKIERDRHDMGTKDRKEIEHSLAALWTGGGTVNCLIEQKQNLNFIGMHLNRLNFKFFLIQKWLIQHEIPFG